VFNPSRDQARDFFFNLWAKSRSGAPLTAIESMALAVVFEHPEYHAMLGDAERYRDREWRPEGGETNPFLHLAMHLAIREQLSIDQPPGIRDAVAALSRKLDSEHEALHDVMECLAEMIWQSQRHGVVFDNATYLECIRRRLNSGSDPGVRPHE
jgi:hypothetical protein